MFKGLNLTLRAKEGHCGVRSRIACQEMVDR